MHADEGRHHLPVRGQGADGCLFIFPHQTTVPFDISTKNGSEFAFHSQYSKEGPILIVRVNLVAAGVK